VFSPILSARGPVSLHAVVLGAGRAAFGGDQVTFRTVLTRGIARARGDRCALARPSFDVGRPVHERPVDGWRARVRPFVVRIVLGVLTFPLSVAACGDTEDRPRPDWRRLPSRSADAGPGRTHSHDAVPASETIRLADDTFSFLVRPYSVSQDRSGRFVVADIADKNLKVYSTLGLRVATIAGGGAEPGQVVTLSAAQPVGDSLIALDVARQRLSWFAPSGRFVRTIDIPPPAIASVRVLDDSLLLYIARMPAGEGLLRVVASDGRILASFLSTPPVSSWDPLVLFHTHLFADGARGRIFAGFGGGDSLFVFDYSGHQVASGLADGAQTLQPLRRQLAANGGRARLRDGNWYYHLSRFLFGVVALPDSTALAFIAPYDTQDGTDLVEGGTIVALGIEQQKVRERRRVETGWGLFGRDNIGDPLFVGYADSTHTRFVLGHDPLDLRETSLNGVRR
jgi:hypothetical protein